MVSSQRGVPPGRGHVVGVDHQRVVPHLVGGEGDGIRLQDQDLLPPLERHRGRILSNPRTDEKRGVGRLPLVQEPGQHAVRKFPRRQGQPVAHQRSHLRQSLDHVVRSESVGWFHPAVGEKDRGRAGSKARVDVEMEISHHQGLALTDSHGTGGEPDPCGMRFGQDVVVPGDDDVEIGGADGGKVLQGTDHRGTAVATDDGQR